MGKLNIRLGCNKPSFPKGLPNLGSVKALIEPKAPAVLDRTKINPNPGMYANDTVGDCTCVAIANNANAVAGLNGYKLPFLTATVLGLYHDVTGYVPNDPNTDQGADPTKVLTFVSRNGILSGTQMLYPIFGTVDGQDRNALANTMNVFGTVYSALALAEADELAMENGQNWDIDTPGNQEAYSWGGHLALPWCYTGLGDTDLVGILTWGTIQWATWRWVNARLVASYGLMWHQIMSANMTNQLGQDWDQIRTESQAFLASVN